jgi:phosphatidylglycerophosphatase A
VRARRSSVETCALAIATLFGAGRSPIVPGTAGTLVAVPLALLAARLLPAWGFAAAAAVLTLLGVWAGGMSARLLETKDPRPVVIDEAAGYFVSLLFMPIDVYTVAGGFILFRIMDIVKPPPAGRVEGWPGGWGIVADDVVAGIYANLSLRALTSLFERIAA